MTSTSTQEITDEEIERLLASLNDEETDRPVKQAERATLPRTERKVEAVIVQPLIARTPTTSANVVDCEFTGPSASAAMPSGTDNRRAELTPTSPYHFPWADESGVSHYSSLTDSQLVSALEELVNRRDRGPQLVSYLAIREEYCAISIIMNLRGVLPPGFRLKRPLPILPKGAKHTDPNTLMLRDRQVVDLHWLHSRGMRRRLSDSKEFVELFLGDDLNRQLVNEFAIKKWSAPTKAAKVLGLLEFEQWQMAVLRSKTIRDKWRNFQQSVEQTIDKRLREQAIREPDLMPDIEDLKRLWLANQIAAGLGQKIVGQIHSWLTSRPELAAAELSKRIKRMRRRCKSKD